MKRTVLCAAALCVLGSSAWAQSTVTLYGIVDSGVRVQTNDGPKGANSSDDSRSVTPGGMSQSRLGFNIVEDLGGGIQGLANLEHRFLIDTGAVAATDFWRQAWVGLKTPYGRITLGRQYNVLFDVFTSTYASFKYSPYIEAFKPEIGMSLGARHNNMVKYLAEFSGLRIGLAASAAEGNTNGSNSTRAGYLRYEMGPFAVGGAYEQLKDTANNKVTAATVGGAYSSGPWYVTLAWARTDPDDKFSRPTLNALLGNAGTNGNFGISTNMDKRDMWSAGVTYQFSPQWNIGGHYWNAKQHSREGTTDGAGKAIFAAGVLDYAFSKRTDAYLEVDHTELSDNPAFTFANGETKRLGYMVGLRHRF
jgi:predicted porin